MVGLSSPQQAILPTLSNESMPYIVLFMHDPKTYITVVCCFGFLEAM